MILNKISLNLNLTNSYSQYVSKIAIIDAIQECTIEYGIGISRKEKLRKEHFQMFLSLSFNN